jgi:hypothetical protein
VTRFDLRQRRRQARLVVAPNKWREEVGVALQVDPEAMHELDQFVVAAVIEPTVKNPIHQRLLGWVRHKRIEEPRTPSSPGRLDEMP